MASVFKALADENRAKIVYALSRAEMCICDVAALIGGSKAKERRGLSIVGTADPLDRKALVLRVEGIT